MLFFNFIGFSQTYEEYKKSQNEQFAKYKRQQNEEKDKLAREFDAYVERADKEFADFLQKEWEEYNAFQGVKVPERPKPVETPKYKPSGFISKLTAKEIVAQIAKPEAFSVSMKPVLPLIQKTDPVNYFKSALGIDYYGTQLSYQFDDQLSKLIIQNINEQGVSSWWTQCSSTNYSFFVNQLLSTKNELSLNDWAYFLLVNKTSDAVADGNLNTARLLTWFLMIRSGYKFKVAFNNNEIFLLFPSANELYGKSYLMIDNDRYYFVDDILSNTFQTYSFDFHGANRVIDFNIYQPLNIGDDVLVRQIKFTHQNRDYSFPVSISVNTLYLLKDYPVTELSVFFNAAMSRVTKQTLAEGLMPIINNMEEEEAINFLLAFVQKTFEYKTDMEQFGKEKFFFPEELFFYSGSDCEDRSALFAYLVKQLLHTEVIGLEYKGHVATAVYVDKNISGDYLYHNKTKYIIADPTFVNAPLGLTMPKYKNQEVRVIETSNINYLTKLTDNYWELTNKLGGFRGNNLCDSKYDSKGNCYLTGYYSQTVSFGDEDWYSETDNRQAFIVKYNKQKEVVWAKNITTNGIATGFAITLDALDNPVVAGCFSGDINAYGSRLSTKDNKEDIFIAAYSSEGELRWLEKSGLDTISYSQFLNYVVKFNDDGEHIDTKLYINNSSNTSNGIFYIDNTFTLVGSINQTLSYITKDLSFDTGSEFNTLRYLKEELDALVANKVDSSIAGLLAAINLIKSSGMVIPGKDAQQAFDKYNPDFRTSSPSIYESIGKVTFMKNNDGIINVVTNNKSVSFDKIRISNGAKLKITSLQNGNEQIDIMSGIEVGKAFIWYDLNFMRMINDTGDLLFDYDSDHTQKTLNMKDDILN